MVKLYTRVAPEIKAQLRDEIDANVLLRAPEQLDLNAGYSLNEKVDIYALGCLIY